MMKNYKQRRPNSNSKPGPLIMCRFSRFMPSLKAPPLLPKKITSSLPNRNSYSKKVNSKLLRKSSKKNINWVIRIKR